MMEDINALLAAAQELPKQEFESGEFTKLPNGSYEAVICDVKFKESKTGKLMFVWEFIITEGQYTKKHEWKYSMLTSPQSTQILLSDLNKFGVNTKTLETIEEDFNLLLDVPVTINITETPAKDPTKEPYRNISVKPCNS
jgi:hypothetical protein